MEKKGLTAIQIRGREERNVYYGGMFLIYLEVEEAVYRLVCYFPFSFSFQSLGLIIRNFARINENHLNNFKP